MNADGAADPLPAHRNTIARMRERVGAALGSWIGDREAVQIALACRTTCKDDLLSFMFNRNLAKSASSCAERVAISDDEFRVLFGSDNAAVRANSCQSATRAAHTRVDRLAVALGCTLAEPLPSCAWKRAHGRAAALFAMETESYETLLAMALGGANRADMRRLEDLRADIEDDEREVVHLSGVITGLSEAVAA